MFWEYEWMIETVVYYVARIALVIACTVYTVDTVRKWARKRRKVARQEAVDAVPVVRCRDCAESAILGDPAKNRRYCAHLGFRVEDEGFCADGRRETDPDPTDDC